MSEQEVLKAEMKARRSARELELGLEHLAQALGHTLKRASESIESRAEGLRGKAESLRDKAEGLRSKADGLRFRAQDVKDKVTHPGDAIRGFVSERASGMRERGRDWVDGMRGQGEGKPLQGRNLLAGVLAAGTMLMLFFVARNRRESMRMLKEQAEAGRHARAIADFDDRGAGVDRPVAIDRRSAA